MKGTILEIVNQESGFILFERTASLENWSSNLEEYACDLRKTRKVKSCLTFLEEEFGRDYEGNLRIIINAEPIEEEELAVPGLLYSFGDFSILAPDGWI